VPFRLIFVPHPKVHKKPLKRFVSPSYNHRLAFALSFSESASSNLCPSHSFFAGLGRVFGLVYVLHGHILSVSISSSRSD
jgi:hypothetical protein